MISRGVTVADTHTATHTVVDKQEKGKATTLASKNLVAGTVCGDAEAKVEVVVVVKVEVVVVAKVVGSTTTTKRIATTWLSE